MFWDILSTFVSTASAWQESNAAARSAAFNQNIARYNANQTRQTGVIEEDRVRREARQRTGIVQANIGASGLNGGTADDILASSIYAGELDALTTRFNYKSQADGLDMQASLYGNAAKDARRGSYLNAASALLKGGTNYYKNETDYGAGSTPFRLGGGSSGRI
jgi:hypothetical protein